MNVGMDIGYSNLKVCFGSSLGDYQTKIVPVGVKAQDDLGLYKMPDGATQVLVDGQDLIAGVPADHGEARALHDKYIFSAEYRALYYAALTMTGVNTIDCLVTGLPVIHYANKVLRKMLMNMLVGEHRINRHKTVNVKKVRVIPQPIGGFLHTIEDDKMEHLSDQEVLIIDPGFFSVDWTLISKCSVKKDTMGSSRKAVSALFEQISNTLKEEYGCNVPIDEIEGRIQAGQRHTYAFSKKIDLTSYIEDAMMKIGPQLFHEINVSISKSGRPFNVILLVGGGAKFYKKAIQNAFGKQIDVIVTDDHILANVLGYYVVCIDT